MKLKELVEQVEAPITDLSAICDWLRKHNKGGHFGGSAGSYGVQIGCAIDLSFKDLNHIPIRITTASSTYNVCHNKLKTLEDCALPRNAVHINISYNPIRSLAGISEIVKTCGSSGGFYQNQGVFDISGCPIEEGGIGLLLIKDLREICCTSLQSSRATRAFAIIKKYIYQKDSIFDCQAELVDAGLEEYAKP